MAATVQKKSSTGSRIFFIALLLTIAVIALSSLFQLMQSQIRDSESNLNTNNNILLKIKEIRSQMANLTMWQYTLRSSSATDREIALKEIKSCTRAMDILADEVHNSKVVDTLYTHNLQIALKQLKEANLQIVQANKAYQPEVIIDSLTVDYRSIFNIANFHVNTVEDLQNRQVKIDNEKRYKALIKNVILILSLLGIIIIVILSLIAARKRAEKSLLQAEKYLSDLFEAMPSALIGLDRHGVIIRQNQKAKELATESEYRHMESQYPCLQDKKQEIMQHLHEGTEYSFDCTNQASKLLRVNLFPMERSSDTEAVLRLEDITAETSMREELNQTKKMNAIGQLAGGIAHDFNNMLAGIMNATELLRLGCTPDEEKLFLELIENTTQRASELTQKLLTFARKSVHKNDPLNVHEVLLATIDLLSHTLDKRITIVSNLNAEKATAVGDKGQIQNIFLNMGINAGQAMPEGGTLVFETRQVDYSMDYCENSPFNVKPGPYIIVEITDNGEGISAHNLEHIFEPFFTTKGSGTGIGLASSYGTVQLMGGEILVDSTPGKGTTFKVALPLDEHHVVKHQVLEQHSINGTGTILVVDDELIMRKSMSLILERLGYSVLLAQNGLEGVEKFRENRERIDLIILDMIMPVMKGDQAMVKIREISKTVPVLICSGYSHSQDIQKVQELSIQGIIPKPYQVAELSHTIASILHKP